MGTSTAVTNDHELVERLLWRVASDLLMVVDRDITIENLETERVNSRAAGADQIHISFKLGFRHEGGSHQGCVLMPLPDAMSLAGYLMMAREEDVLAYREQPAPDDALKDAMREISNFVAGSCDAVVRDWLPGGPSVSVVGEGCQGVRADVRPALQYEEGDELILGRADVRVGELDPFELLVMLPALPPLA